MKKYLISITITIIALLFPIQTKASCDPNLGDSTHTITTSCSFTGYADAENGSRILSGLDSGSGTTNSSVLTVSSGILTINANETLVAGSFEFSGGSIAIADGGKFIPNGTLWALDTDNDGYPEETQFYVRTTALTDGVRLNSISSNIATTDCDDSTYSETNSCTLTRNITVSYSGTELINHNILIDLDTTTPIATGDMTSDCGDIRIYDSDNSTPLDYWIESGCDTSNTQIWVEVPIIPDGGKTIYMHYDGTTTTDGTLAWSGNFTLLNNSTCPSGWTQNSAFDSKFPYGSDTYGSIGGASSHTHANWSGSTSSGGNLDAGSGGGGGVTLHDKGGHTHAITVSHDSATDVLPPYLAMVFCYNNQLNIDSGLISLFEYTPNGWTRFTALDSKFPYGNTSYGATGGSTTHNHAMTRTSYSPSNTASCYCCGSATRANPYHTSGATNTGNGSNVPPYLSMIFSSADSNTQGVENMITIVDSLPPLGWNRYTELDSKLPYGASNYGSTGGSSTHTHSANYTEGSGGVSNCAGGGLTRAKPHSHSVSYTTASASNVPPYVTAIFAQRNAPSATISVGDQY